MFYKPVPLTEDKTQNKSSEGYCVGQFHKSAFQPAPDAPASSGQMCADVSDVTKAEIKGTHQKTSYLFKYSLQDESSKIYKMYIF